MLDSFGHLVTDSFSVTVVDTTAPLISGTPADISVPADGPSGSVVSWTAPTAADLVDGPVPVACDPASGSTFPAGATTPVTCTAVDSRDNSATTSFNVTVAAYLDQVPTLDLPDPITAEATGPAGAIVTYEATASDLEDGELTPSCDPTSGSTFPLGTTPVECSVLDSFGHLVTDSFSVTVVDTTAPLISGTPADISVPADGPSGSVVSWTAPTAADLVDGPVPVACDPASGSTFPAGATTPVTCTAVDSRDNSATTSFDVTVAAYLDQVPTLDLPDPITAEATGPAGAIVTYEATASDLEDGELTPSCDPTSGSTFPLGTTPVECSVLDSFGHLVTDSFSVTVVDTTAPLISGTPADISVPADGPSGSVVSWTAPTAADLVDGPVPVACDPASGSTFPAGATTPVTCTAVDSRDNSATTSFDVTVTTTDDPPTAPAGVTARVTTVSVALDWDDNSEPDLAGYFVYRSSAADGPWTKLRPRR